MPVSSQQKIENMDSEGNQSAQQKNKPVIGITLGDINGIGPEVVIKALSDPRVMQHITPVVFGSTKVLSYYKKMLDIDNFQYSQAKSPDMIHARRINVVNCWNEMVEIKVGEVTEEGGKCAFLALEKAMDYLKGAHIDALVTAPINKKNIQSDAFNFVGHTEYITAKLDAAENLMLMVAEEVRVGLVSTHVAIRDVAGDISREKIDAKLKILIKSLKTDFGIDKPKVAVLGLNPHAGEDGLLGEEERDIIEPLVNEYKKKGKLVFGPFPADGFFGMLQHKKYDGVLAMYHDQGLIPFKLLCFESGVNFTAGIPKVRTSPDHGTAYDIAGKNAADHTSIREAIYLASNIVKNRSMREEPLSV
jgi:4-hydroxythreonine-4-phosphate dehydrogenase